MSTHSLSGTQFKQLSMFEPAMGLRYQSASADAATMNHTIVAPGQMWDQKLAQAKDVTSNYPRGHVPEGAPSLYDRVKATGVRTPVTLDPDYQGPERYKVINGHHRVAAAADVAQTEPGRMREEVPVRWGNQEYDADEAAQERQYMHSPAPEERRHFPEWKS